MRIELPQVGESVTEGIIGKWLREVGDRVEKYDPLVEVVTDKVDMEFPSPAAGVITAILAKEGETVPMGAVIAEMEADGEEEDGNAGERPADSAERETPQTIDRTGILVKDAAPVGPTGSGGPLSAPPAADTRPQRQRSSPAVLRLAREHGVDLSHVTGTGMGGRVSLKDVRSYIASAEKPETGGAETADQERVPLTPVRRIIAENMVKSASQIPQAWSMVEVDVSSLVQLRESARAEVKKREGANLTYLPFVVKVVAAALADHPLLNSSWDGDAIVMKRRINIGVAVAGAEGLVVPVIHDAGSLSIAILARAIEDLTSRARSGKLRLEDVRGGTFTVNNTGVLGSIVSRPLVNYPQAAIVSTEAIVKRPVVVGDAIAIRSIMNLCLTFDHRVMDGADAGAFIGAVKTRLEAIGPDTAIF